MTEQQGPEHNWPIEAAHDEDDEEKNDTKNQPDPTSAFTLHLFVRTAQT